jgi:hypothetical protein
MSELIDCTYEFTIRQQINYAKRMLAEWGHTNVSVTLMPDPESNTGVSIVLVDNASGASHQVDPSLFDELQSLIAKANSKSTYGQ